MVRVFALVSLFWTSGLLAEESVSNLTWMTGSWIGSMGPSTIEEIWSKPKSGSMQATVRITTEAETLVHEVVVISEQQGTLVLYLQQWSPSFEPLGALTTMRLSSQSENSVTFEGEPSAMVQKLTYSRVADDQFTIAVTAKGQPEFVMQLTPND